MSAAVNVDYYSGTIAIGNAGVADYVYNIGGQESFRIHVCHEDILIMC